MTKDEAELGFKPKPGFTSPVPAPPLPHPHPACAVLGGLAEITDKCFDTAFHTSVPRPLSLLTQAPQAWGMRKGIGGETNVVWPLMVWSTLSMKKLALGFLVHVLENWAVSAPIL